MLLSQILIAHTGGLAFAKSKPNGPTALFPFGGVASATQDIVIDAYRIA